MNKLHISDDLSLPADVLAQTQAILAIKGAGKTYAAMKMMEETVKSGFQAVAIDPTGVWWGLSADGEGKALPVLVMGGEHGNVPLESTSGEVVAEFIVDSARSVVLDLSLMKKAEMHRFMAAFLDRLYHYKATRRENLHIFFDEADTAAPQKPGPEQAKVLGAAEDVVGRGRSRGLGMTLITRRPAVINKNLLEMCETLYVMRIVSAKDQDAVLTRVSVDGDVASASAMTESLAKLQNGEAWVWSPATLGIFRRIKFGPKQTFDSSRSPRPGERALQPKARAEINLADLTARIKATVEKSKENDPKHLRAELAKAKGELTKLQQAKPAAVKVEHKTIEKPVLKDGQLDRADKLIAGLADLFTKMGERQEQLKATVDGIAKAIQSTRVPMPAAAVIRVAPPPRAAVIPTPVAHSPRPKVQSGNTDERRLGGAQKRLLDAAAWWLSIGVDAPTRAQVGFVARIKPTGGHFSNSIGPLITNGLLENVGDGQVRLTDAGAAAATTPESAPTLADYHRSILAILTTGAQQRIFEAVIAQGQQEQTLAQIGEATGIDPNGGHFSNSIGPLSTLGLVDRRAGMVRPTELLYPTGLI